MNKEYVQSYIPQPPLPHRLLCASRHRFLCDILTAVPGYDTLAFSALACHIMRLVRNKNTKNE